LILQLGQRKLNINVENVVTEIAYNYTFYEEKTNFFYVNRAEYTHFDHLKFDLPTLSQ